MRNIHQMIGSAYNLAMEQRLVSRNPAHGCALPEGEHKEMQTLPADQLTSFFREARDSGACSPSTTSTSPQDYAVGSCWD